MRSGNSAHFLCFDFVIFSANLLASESVYSLYLFTRFDLQYGLVQSLLPQPFVTILRL